MKKAREVATDERTEVVQGQNTRFTWCFTLVALGIAIFYRHEVLGQETREFLDILLIFFAAVVLQVILDLRRGGITRAAVGSYPVIGGGLLGVVLYGGSELVGGASSLAEAVLKTAVCAVLWVLLVLAVKGWAGRGVQGRAVGR